MLDREMATKTWAVGDAFTLADCVPEWTGELLARLTVAQLQLCQPLTSESV